MDKATRKIQTKVSPEAYARLLAIDKQYGMSIFKLLQMLCDCLIRFMDSDLNLSEDLLRIIRMFEGLPGWRNSISLAECPDEETGIVEAFYVIRRKGQQGCRLVMVERPMMDGDVNGWTCTYNLQRIFERFMELSNPCLYLHLRRLSVDLGTESLLDTIHTIANLYKENPDEKELRLQFENNDWHERGRMTQDTVYARRRSHTMDYVERGKLFDKLEAQNEENELTNNFEEV